MTAPSKFPLLLVSATVAFVLSLATQAQATAISLDCQSGCSDVPFAGAIWSTDSTHPSGTGVFNPFLRLHATGQSTFEDGHNTDVKSQDFLNDEMGGIWTHSVELSTLTPFEINGVNYFAFALDTGEPATTNKSPVSLDALKLCTSSDPALTKVDDCPTQPYQYNLDAGGDSEVLLDYNLIGMGNGASDLVVYIPAFTSPDKYLYLYSMLGAKGGAFQADGTFSEWAFINGPAVIPEPASLFLLGTGLAGLAARERRRRRRSPIA